RHDHHEVRTLHRRLRDPPRGVDAARVGMQEQRRHHARIERRLAERAAVAADNPGKIKRFPHERHDQPRQMSRGHIVLNARRQKLCVVDLPGAKILAHKSARNQTRRLLTSDYSDRPLVPTFAATVAALWDGLVSGRIIYAAFTSIKVLLQGYVVALFFAALLPAFASATRVGADLLETLTSMFNPLPSIALLP